MTHLFALAAAVALDWSGSFPSEVLATWLDGPASYLVAPAGPGADGVASAVIAALRGSGRAELVMDAKALGPIADADDATVVKKAAALPIARIAVVRVFEDRAVVTVYEKTSGAVSTAFSVKAGTPLATRTGSGVPAGVSRAAAAAVAKVLPTPAANASEEYEKRYIDFDEIVGINGYGAVVGRWTEPYQGKYRKPLGGSDFYQAIGRTDLVDSYRRRMANKVLLIAAGVGAMAGSIALAAEKERGSCAMTDFTGGCMVYNTDHPNIASSIVLGVAGAGAIVWGALLSAHPIDAPEARRLADEYNKDLRRKLNLSAAVAPAPGGGQVAVAGRF